MIKQGRIFYLLAFCFCFYNILPAKAVNVTFDSNLFTGEVHDNVSSSININTQTGANGFSNFFDSNFLLLGANPNDNNIPSDSFRFGTSTATSTSIDIVGGQNYKLKFDWAFQGNSTGNLLNLDLDEFTLSFVGIGSNSDINIDLLTTNEYGSERNKTYTISGNSLLSGSYNVVANLTEGADLTSHSSAAGLDNFTIEQVPFEFSPTQGLLIVGGFWLFSSLRKNIVHR